MKTRDPHLRGAILTAVGVMLLSPDSLLLRLIGGDHWTLLFWRGVLSAIGLIAISLFLERPRGMRSLLDIGRWGIVVAVNWAIGGLCFVYAIMNTTVANVMVIISISPLLGAVCSHFMIHEKVPLRTWMASVAVFLGLVILLSGSIVMEGITGDLAAFGAALVLAVNFVIIRRERSVSMIPAMALSGVIIALVASPLASPASLSPTGMRYMFLLGLFIIPLSLSLITLGPRHLPAPEVTLIMRLETLLAPLWVWLVIGESPSKETLAGGGLILITLIFLSVATLRQNRLPGQKVK